MAGTNITGTNITFIEPPKYTNQPTPKDPNASYDDYYTTGEKLGSGAFSKVFVSTEKSTQKQYAAKIVSRNQPLPGSRNKELMFDVEIRINQKLGHKNIVNLYEMFTNPKLTLIFDLVTGGELFDDIEKRTCYSEADSAACIKQVLQGVEYIHSQKVIHRDLKPENLLLTDNSTIKIADFGLAVEFNTDEDLIFGTAGSPDYIAPEILNKHYYNKKVDIWSCGVILYILLCGYPPFENREDQKCGAFKFYAEDWQEIDVEARTLIVRMLTVNQKQRIDSTMALNSKWILEHDKRSKVHRPKMIQKLKQFNAKRKFKGGVNAVIATQRMSSKLVFSSPTSRNGSIGSGNSTENKSNKNHGSPKHDDDSPNHRHSHGEGKHHKKDKKGNKNKGCKNQ